MSGTLYEIYQSKIFTLAKTIVIKHEMVADLINKQVMAKGYQVIESDKTTWKYYMNLAGEYHQSDIDLLKAKYNTEYMVIRVAGDNRPVDAYFNKRLISGPTADLATANEYRYGSHLYNNLLSRYPEMETLILGILNPIDVDVAIKARDGEILYCGGYKKAPNPVIEGSYHYVPVDQSVFVKENLVEVNETNFISNLQDWVDMVLSRWHIHDYIGIDNLYVPSVLSLLYTYLPKQISNIRLANAKKNVANSYHVRQYLDSHGKLGEIVDLFNPKEYLWVYRNFKWLEANLGKEQTYRAIIDNIFTPSNIPLNGYRLKHNIQHMPMVYHPHAEMIREPINLFQVGAGSEHRTIEYILNREIPLARSNWWDLDRINNEMQEDFDSSGDSTYETKVLESNVIDYTLRSPYPIADVLINNLIYAASHGYYKGTVYVDHPTRNERLQLTPLNAVILLIYCFTYGFTGNKLVDIPDMMVRSIPRHKDGLADLSDQPYPTVESLYNLVNIKKATATEINNIYKGIYTQPVYNSTNHFYTGTIEIQKEMMRRYHICARNEDIKGRGYLARVMAQMYWLYVPCKLNHNNLKYDDWLNTHGIHLEPLTRKGYIKFAYNLLSAATGEDTHRRLSMSEKQRAAINLLKHFASYNIQIITSSTDSPVTLLEGSNLRYSNFMAGKKTSGKLLAPYVTVKHHFIIKNSIFIDMFSSKYNNYKTKYIAKVKINGDAFQMQRTKGFLKRRINIKGITILGVRVVNNEFDTKWFTNYPLLPVTNDEARTKLLNLDISITDNQPKVRMNNTVVTSGIASYTSTNIPKNTHETTVDTWGYFEYEE